MTPVRTTRVWKEEFINNIPCFSRSNTMPDPSGTLACTQRPRLICSNFSPSRHHCLPGFSITNILYVNDAAIVRL